MNTRFPGFVSQRIRVTSRFGISRSHPRLQPRYLDSERQALDQSPWHIYIYLIWMIVIVYASGWTDAFGRKGLLKSTVHGMGTAWIELSRYLWAVCVCRCMYVHLRVEICLSGHDKGSLQHPALHVWFYSLSLRYALSVLLRHRALCHLLFESLCDGERRKAQVCKCFV